MLRKLYYTQEITTASLMGTAIMILFFVYDGILIHGIEAENLIVQVALISIVYFAVYFIAFFFLINIFDDFLKKKYNKFLAPIIVLVIGNIILLFGLYVDTSYSLLEVVIANYRILLATNIAILFFSIKKSSAKSSTGKV